MIVDGRIFNLSGHWHQFWTGPPVFLLFLALEALYIYIVDIGVELPYSLVIIMKSTLQSNGVQMLYRI
jgi:hypothetical protein